MSTSVVPVEAGQMRFKPSIGIRITSAIIAALGTALVVVVALVVLGAYVPRIPKAGMVGPVLTGQYPFHMAFFAALGGLLAVLAWWLGRTRWGISVTALAAITAVGALVVGGIQYVDAKRAGTAVSWREVYSQLFLPAAAPDVVATFAEPDGTPLRVDVYLPPRRSDTPAPAVVLAHAGGFHTFDKKDLRGLGRWLAEHGVAAFAIDYRLATAEHATWNQSPQDVACAIGWVQNNAANYHVDPARVSVGGMSAGGTLAINAGYRLALGSITSSCGNNPAPPASVIGFYPGTDVTWLWNNNYLGSREAAEMFTGGTPARVPDRYQEVSPTSNVRAGLPRTLLVVGDRDRSAAPHTVTDYADALTAVGVENHVHILPFAEHAFDDAYGSLTSQTSRQVLLDFLTSTTSASGAGR